MNRIAVVITRLRTERGWSQSELARRSGLRQTHISQIEGSEMKGPSLTTLEKLAAAFGITASELVRQIEETTPVPDVTQ